MFHLPRSATDDDLIRFIDRWVELLEREDYVAAFAYTTHDRSMGWTPDLIRDVIKRYGEARPDQKVTLAGRPTDIVQRREVLRWKTSRHGSIGEVWYDLHIDGLVSDLTATFAVKLVPGGLELELSDIHVM